MMNHTFKLTALALTTSLLAACGGGGGSGGGSSTPSGKTFSGVAVDFYLENATVRLDDCNNYTITNATDNNGKFKFTLPTGCTASAITITGGIDTVTKKEFTGTLKVKSRNLENIDNAVASPLTTLEAILPEADFKEVLKNLGFLETIDVNSFNPVTQGSAEQLATVFLVQQLLTQIEDAIEESGASADAATSIAAEALGEVLKNEPLISNGVYNTSLFADIVAEAEELVPFIIDTTSIANNVTAISTAISTVGLSGNGSALVDALTSPTNSVLLEVIQESIPAAPVIPSSEFTQLEIGGRSLAEFKNSSEATPMLLAKEEFSGIPTINLTLARPNVNVPETAKIGLEVNAGPKYLSLVLDSVKIYFNGVGLATKAVLPAGSSVKVQSNVTKLGSYNNFTITPNTDIELTVNNGVIDLGSFSDKSDSLQSAFNTYYNEVVTVGAAQVKTYVKLSSYTASPNLGINRVPSANVLGTVFTNAYYVEGYFKFNPVTTP